jgi:two-component sensor histidine kinase
MSTIFSILSLQASKFRDKEVIDAFEEAKTRIRLMQSIYQKLYTGSDAHSIKISDYLRELLSDIEKTYSLSGTVRINAEIEDCIVSAKQSLPIGIVVNELVSNSLKYAFSPFNEGSIEVVVRKSDLSYLEVIVSDDGSGLPREVVEEGEYGFGLTLVEGYAIQYEGELSIENSPAGGSRIRVSMELEGL